MRILMLGNSLTTAHGLPDRLASALDAEVVVHARGGARLAEHLNPKTRNGARTLAALAPVGPSGEPAHPLWDYVVLQEMSHAPATTPEAYARSVAALCALARGAGTTPVIYATWAYRGLRCLLWGGGSCRALRTGRRPPLPNGNGGRGVRAGTCHGLRDPLVARSLTCGCVPDWATSRYRTRPFPGTRRSRPAGPRFSAAGCTLPRGRCGRARRS